VSGKTGTAEFGNANPPATHAWFIGFQGDVAFAVLVEGGGVGATVAAPIAGRFVAGL
jgi:cell division protein FtsI/penicillin-binding protein 2